MTYWSPNSQLVKLVEGNSQLVELKYFKIALKTFLVELPFNSNFMLKISSSTRDECNVYNKISNNYTLSNQ